MKPSDCHAFLTIGWLLTAAGCATAPTRPQSLPAEAAGTPPSAVRPPVAPATAPPALNPPSERGLSLHRLLEYAERHSPLIEVAVRRGQLGDAEVEAASPPFAENPEVAARVGYRTTADGSGIDYEIEASHPIPLSGERAARLRAARGAKRVRSADLEWSRWQLRQAIRREYRLALVDRARTHWAAEAIRHAERLRRIAERRRRSGDIAPMPVLAAEAEVARARAEKVAADTDYLARRRKLAELSGWPPAAVPPLPNEKLAAPVGLPSVARLVATARANHAGRSARRAHLFAAEATAAAEARAAWPSPSLGASFAQEAEPGAPTPARIVSLRITWQLPLWQRNQGPRRRARVEATVARAELAAFDRELELRLQQLVDRANAAATRIRVYSESALPKLDEALRLSERAFELGEAELLGVLTARGRALDVRREALEVYEDYYAALTELESEVGIELVPAASQSPRLLATPSPAFRHRR